MKIGDKIWLFDSNRKKYEKGNSAPIYSEHFYQEEIVGETSRSWLVGYFKNKFSKKDPIGLYTDEMKADKIWEYDNRYKIVALVERCSIKQLKKINDILIQEVEDKGGAL